ncbi:MAG: endonuclease/exonuclease/phosphatase family protein [Bacteroidales bacterium]
MKYLKISTLIVVAFFTFKIAIAQKITTMTFNIHYDNTWDEKNSWEFRKESVVKMINHYSPGILGIQEGLHNQVQYLEKELNSYKYIGVGREDGKQKGEYCAIYYDTTEYYLIQSTTFWLSENPETISVGWDAALERICTAGLFQHIESGKNIWVFNTHFDHIGQVARKMSAQLILRKIIELNSENLPLVLMGDFNAIPNSEPINILKTQLTEASTVSQKPFYGPVGTFNNFNSANSTTDCIDFIFISQFTIASCTHIDDKKNDNLCISDHYPVLVEISFKF